MGPRPRFPFALAAAAAVWLADPSTALPVLSAATSFLAKVEPLAEDYFDEGYAHHACLVTPSDENGNPKSAPYTASCDSFGIAELDTSVPLEITQTASANAGADGYGLHIDAAVHVDKDPQHAGRSRRTVAWPEADGTRNILLVRMVLTDAGVGYCDEACVRAAMWGGSASADAIIRASSYNRINFDEGDSEVITVNIAKAVSDYVGCDYYGFRSDVIAAAQAQHSITSSDFTHIAIYIPTTLACTWGGLGNVRGGSTWYRSGHAGVLAHELGHNLGTGHAGTDPEDDGVLNVEYGDYSCVMGRAYSGPPTIHAPHRLLLGWLGENNGRRSWTVDCAASGGVETVRISRVDLDPDGNSVGPNIVSIPRAANGDDWYFLSYKSTADTDGSRTPSASGRVHVHHHVGPDNGYAHSQHVAGLVSSSAAFNGLTTNPDDLQDMDFTVEVVAMTDDYADVRIVPDCKTSAPTAVGETWTPTSAPTIAPTANNHKGPIQCGDTVAGDTSLPGINTIGGASSDHVYSFAVVGSVATAYRFDTCGSDFDTYLRVYDGAGVQVEACDDCGSCGYRTVLDTAALAPGSYTLVVEGYSSNQGAYTLTMSGAGGAACPEVPTTTQSPTSPTPTPFPTPSPTPSLPPTRQSCEGSGREGLDRFDHAAGYKPESPTTSMILQSTSVSLDSCMMSCLTTRTCRAFTHANRLTCTLYSVVHGMPGVTAAATLVTSSAHEYYRLARCTPTCPSTFAEREIKVAGTRPTFASSSIVDFVAPSLENCSVTCANTYSCYSYTIVVDPARSSYGRCQLYAKTFMNPAYRTDAIGVKDLYSVEPCAEPCPATGAAHLAHFTAVPQSRPQFASAFIRDANINTGDPQADAESCAAFCRDTGSLACRAFTFVGDVTASSYGQCRLYAKLYSASYLRYNAAKTFYAYTGSSCSRASTEEITA